MGNLFSCMSRKPNVVAEPTMVQYDQSVTTAASRGAKTLSRSLGPSSSSSPSPPPPTSTSPPPPPPGASSLSSDHHHHRLRLFKKKVPENDHRNVHSFGSNRIRTSKYTAWNFLPYNLYHQFKRYYNLYFLTAAVFSIIPNVNPLSPITSIVPLAIIVLITLVKDGHEDIKRHRSDRLVNQQLYQVARFQKEKSSDGSRSEKRVWQHVRSEDIRVGDFVRVERDVKVPVDLVVLYAEPSPLLFSSVDDNGEPVEKVPSSEDEVDPGTCFMETSDLDGETNIKRREAPSTFTSYLYVDSPSTSPAMSSNSQRSSIMDRLLGFLGIFQVEPPNDRIHSFRGRLLPATSLSCPSSEELTAAQSHPSSLCHHTIGQATPLTTNHFLPRASVLKSTHFIVGVVIYIGPNTKIFRNAARRTIGTKSSSLAHALNILTLFIFVINFFCLSITVLFGGFFLRDTAAFSMYLLMRPISMFSTIMSWNITNLSILQAGANFILFTFMVPISLFISIEMVRVVHATFMQWDEKMTAAPVSSSPSPLSPLMSASTANPPTHPNASNQSTLGSSETAPLVKQQPRHCIVRNYNLHEDLARVRYIFTDKTGTLTENKMKIVSWLVLGLQAENRVGTGMQTGEVFDQQARPDVLYHSLDEPHLGTALQNQLVLYVYHVALCHTVLPTRSPSGEIVYEGQSPDEIAIIQALVSNRVILKSRSKSRIVVDYMGIDQSFDILHSIEFTSERRRSSIVIRTPEGRIVLFSKGADTVILPQQESQENRVDGERYAHFQHQMDNLSATGLRILVQSFKFLSQADWTRFSERLSSIESDPSISLSDRDENITLLVSELESDMTPIGAIAIEDKLQEEVPATIAFLLEAGMRIWLLTGDKKETAMNIGRTTGLIPRQHTVESCIVSSAGEYEQVMNRIWQKIQSMHSTDTETGTSFNFVLLIDGPTLETALLDYTNQAQLLRVGLRAASVICCRVSPLQKTLVVRLVKKSVAHLPTINSDAKGLYDVRKPTTSDSRNQQGLTLAIGDGANDVGMIEMAHIGVGIAGLEGGQASRASDYSIIEFRYLKRLLVVHGRYSYLRLSKLILISIYKNFTLILTQFFFGIYSGWSAQTIYNSYFLLLYNVIITSFSPFIMAVFEKDVTEENAERYPRLYQPLRDGYYFNVVLIARTFIFSFYNAAVIFFFFYAMANFIDLSNANGKSVGLPVQQTYMSAMTFLTVTMRTAMMTRHWIIWNLVALVLSVVIFVADMFVLQGADYFQLYGGTIVHQLPIYYFSLLLIPLTCLLPEILIKYYRKQYYPRDTDILHEQDVIAKTSRE